MDVQMFFNVGASAGLAGIGWFARQLWEAVSLLRRDLHSLERDLPVFYVRKDEFLDHMRRIEAKLDRIAERLEDKEDRHRG